MYSRIILAKPLWIVNLWRFEDTAPSGAVKGVLMGFSSYFSNLQTCRKHCDWFFFLYYKNRFHRWLCHVLPVKNYCYCIDKWDLRSGRQSNLPLWWILFLLESRFYPKFSTLFRMFFHRTVMASMTISPFSLANRLLWLSECWYMTVG